MGMPRQHVSSHDDQLLKTVKNKVIESASAYHRHPNDSCKSYAPHEMLAPSYKTAFGIMIFITALITLILNLFVIITLWSNQKRQSQKRNGESHAASRQPSDNLKQQHLSFSNTHQSFISLSISVIIYSSICVPGMFIRTIDDVSSSGFVVFLLVFLFYVSPIASSFMHLLMAFDRYLAIKQCFTFRVYWYRRNYTTCIWLLWSASVLIVVPFYWYKGYSENVRITLTLVRLLVTFSIPSLLTLALYLSIANELAKIQKSDDFLLVQTVPMFTKHQKLIIKIIILGVIHFLCWFPFSVVESLNDLFPDLFHRCSTDTHVVIYYYMMSILILVTSMSGIAYPILYCFVSKQFRDMFWASFKSLCSNEKHPPYQNEEEYSSDGPSTVTTNVPLSSFKSNHTTTSRKLSPQRSFSSGNSYRRKSLEDSNSSSNQNSLL